MTDKEKILALEIEMAKLKTNLLAYKSEWENPAPDAIYKRTLRERVFKALAAQPPSEVIESLKSIKILIEDMRYPKFDNAKDRALAILKELGVE